MSLERLIDEACEENDIVTPLNFLACVMSGSDPRGVSAIWKLIEGIEEENFGEMPTEEQWEQVIEVVELNYKSKPVDLNSSQRAATLLAEYKHPKRKAKEGDDTSINDSVPELTPTEFNLFKEWFNGGF